MPSKQTPELPSISAGEAWRESQIRWWVGYADADLVTCQKIWSSFHFNSPNLHSNSHEIWGVARREFEVGEAVEEAELDVHVSGITCDGIVKKGKWWNLFNQWYNTEKKAGSWGGTRLTYPQTSATIHEVGSREPEAGAGNFVLSPREGRTRSLRLAEDWDILSSPKFHNRNPDPYMKIPKKKSLRSVEKQSKAIQFRNSHFMLTTL